MKNGLEQLCIELVDRAYELDRRGRLDAADLAMEMAGRIDELIAASQNQALSNQSRVSCPDEPLSLVGTVNHSS